MTVERVTEERTICRLVAVVFAAKLNIVLKNAEKKLPPFGEWQAAEWLVLV
jgi:hypothetical protein